MRVKAIKLGYYGHKRRRVGEVFDLSPVKSKDGKGNVIIIPAKDQFSKAWMEEVKGKGKAKVEPEPEEDEYEELSETADNDQEVI